jgi:integrase
MAATQSIYPLDSSLTLAVAAPKWLAAHQQYIQPNTLKNYRNSIRLLTASLGEMRLKDIRIDYIRAYQAQRSMKAGSHLVNGELGVLQMILKQAGEWSRIKEFYKPLRVPTRGAGHSLTQEEEARLRAVAFTKPKWRLAAHCMMVMLSTTMGFGELRQLRRHDVDMKRQSILVREGAKNRFRNRTIPLNSTAVESMTWILERWKKLGGDSDEHYILPHRPRSLRGPWLLDEPMSAITSAFNQIRKAAGLSHFRIYDCRVQAITKLLSNPMVSPQVSREIAGHISQAMQDRYSIQRFDTKKAALDALEDSSSRPPEAVPSPVPTSPPPMDFTHATFQAEIARQVALALQERFPMPTATEPPAREKQPRRRRNSLNREQRYAPVAKEQGAPRLVVFPGGATCR